MRYSRLQYPQLLKLQKEILKCIQNHRNYKFNVGEYKEGKLLYITDRHIIGIIDKEECLFNYNSTYISGPGDYPTKIKRIIDRVNNIDNANLYEVVLKSVIIEDNFEYAIFKDSISCWTTPIISYKYLQFFDIEKYNLKLYAIKNNYKSPIIIKTPDNILIGIIYPIINAEGLIYDMLSVDLLDLTQYDNEDE